VGNARARKHGAYARVAHARLEAKQREVFDALAEDAPLRDPDGGLPAADGVTVALLAQALCRLDDVGGYLTNHDLCSEGVRDAARLQDEVAGRRSPSGCGRRTPLRAASCPTTGPTGRFIGCSTSENHAAGERCFEHGANY
jgi:hypothetical protein